MWCSGSGIELDWDRSCGGPLTELLELADVFQAHLEIAADRTVAELEAEHACAPELLERGACYGQLETIAPSRHTGEELAAEGAGVFGLHDNVRLAVAKQHRCDRTSQSFAHVSFCGGISRA